MSMIIDGSAGVTFPAGSNPQAAPSKVLQVVNATTNTQTSNSTSTYADTNLTATITPLFSTSKILVIIDQCGVYRTNGNNSNAVNIKIVRNSTDLIFIGKSAGYSSTTQDLSIGSVSSNYLDSPATTSSVTYKTQFACQNNTAYAFVQVFGDTSTITLMEIAQ
jgi:hypothetical protein